MKSPARLKAIQLEGFRGFAKAQSLDLDADVILVRGDNGSGKTSLVDGILWLLTGELARLKDLAKSQRRGSDPIINLYAGEVARVRLAIATGEGRVLDFERCGNTKESELSAWDGETRLSDASELLARTLGDLTVEQLPEAVKTWGILQQHNLKAALGSGVLLHQRMSAVLGLERVTLFTESATRVVRSLLAERKQLESARNQLQARHKQRAEALAAAHLAVKEPDAAHKLIATRLRDITAELPSGIGFAQTPADLDGITALGTALGELIDTARDVARRHSEAVTANASVTVTADGVEAELVRLTGNAEEIAQTVPLRIQLATSALGLLGDRCPVCDQSIDEQTVRKHMLELIEASQIEAVTIADMQRSVAQTQLRLLKAREAEGVRAHVTQGRESAVSKVRQLLEAMGALQVEEELLSPELAGALVDALELLRTRLREVFIDAQRLDSEHVSALQSETEKLGQEVERAERDLLVVDARHRHAVALDGAAKQAAERIVKRALARLEPSFAEVFDRLAPHPTFTELRAKQDIYYKQNQIVPEVYDVDRKLSANPELVFSEGQSNVVALSYFLGLALNAREGALPFLVLDDPLQTMDILSVLGFADMCRRIREHRQILVTTHDRRFAALLARKLTPRETGYRTIMHEFDGWTREGPSVEEPYVPFAEVVPLLREQAF